jgi:transcription initiation factor TFIID subunit 12
MNANQTQGQQGQAAQQSNPAQIRLFRPEMMRGLPEQISAEEKKKWETGLTHLYQQMKDTSPDSQAYQSAKTRLVEFSQNLHRRLQNIRAQSGQGQARPSSQAAPPQSQVQGAGNAASLGATQPSKAQGSSNKPSDQILNYVNSFPYVLPQQLTQGTPEAQKWLTDAKNRLGKALYTMETASRELKNLDIMSKERKEQGNPLSQEENKDYLAKKEALQKQHSDAKRYSDGFRKSQEQQGASVSAPAVGQQSMAQQGGGNATAGPQRPAVNAQQTQNGSLPGVQAVNSAIQSARNQQINASNTQNAVQPTPQAEQVPQASSGQPTNATSHPTMPQAAVSQNTNVKVEGGSNQPQLNTAAATAPHIQTNLSRTQNSPHSAVPQSAASVGAPRALTHQAALTQAARTYSSGQTSATSVMGSHAHPSVQREIPNINTNKMPIPKQLPPAAIGTPQQVPMQPSRPTLSGGPSNAGSGQLGQPALQKTPGFNLEGEGERVMSKKKLDELVRQVTGGGDGLDSGEALSPEVEDVSIYLSCLLKKMAIIATCVIPNGYLSILYSHD